jgi:hypothetical protein
MADRVDDVAQARSAFADDLARDRGFAESALADVCNDMSAEELAPQSIAPSSPPARPACAPARPYQYSCSAPAWGTEHPDYRTTKTTARWTQAEKEFLGRWCGQFSQRYPEVTNVVASCLKHLRLTPAAVAIFHEKHTLNSARLRTGLRQFQNELAREEKLRLGFDAVNN